MGSIPAWLLRHTVEVEPLLAEGTWGPEYGPQATVRCFVDDKRQKILGGNGSEIIAQGVLYAPLTTVCPVGSRITLPGGRQAIAQAVQRRDGGGLPTPDHLEIALQ